tara:strand:+ start:346 stop:624 length:279 start_codon:yes stop_codon:yes gene_type:complete
METKMKRIYDDNASINDFLSELSEDVTQEKYESFRKSWSVLTTYALEGLKSENIEGTNHQKSGELAKAMGEVLFAHDKLCQVLEAKKKGLIE